MDKRTGLHYQNLVELFSSRQLRPRHPTGPPTTQRFVSDRHDQRVLADERSVEELCGVLPSPIMIALAEMPLTSDVNTTRDVAFTLNPALTKALNIE